MGPIWWPTSALMRGSRIKDEFTRVSASQETGRVYGEESSHLISDSPPISQAYLTGHPIAPSIPQSQVNPHTSHQHSQTTRLLRHHATHRPLWRLRIRRWIAPAQTSHLSSTWRGYINHHSSERLSIQSHTNLLLGCLALLTQPPLILRQAASRSGWTRRPSWASPSSETSRQARKLV